MTFLQRVLLAFLAGWTTSAFVQSFGWFPLLMILCAAAAVGIVFLAWCLVAVSGRKERAEEEGEL